jgi:7-carboxy-7-deazaguanine synthase
MPVNANATAVGENTDRNAESGLPINELFYSLQGEGKLTGVPSIFIRTSGCNLRCWYCDSYHTSWDPRHAWMDLDDIVDAVAEYDDAEHVVITGGEPLLHDEIVDLLDILHDAGYHTTVETNGTIYRDAAIDLVSISPKLASSTPTADRDPKGDGEWATRHEQRRIDMDQLTELVRSFETQLKFVVTSADDMPEINELVSQIRATVGNTLGDSQVLLMPEGQTRDELDDRRKQVAELAMAHGYRYTPRLHVDLWNDAPGT